MKSLRLAALALLALALSTFIHAAEPGFKSIFDGQTLAGWEGTPAVWSVRDGALTKLTLYGLTGPIEVNGKKYDGQVPMTPFGGMLNDAEVAAVLTYVRNSFGNAAAPIQPEEVQKVRAQQPGRMMLYNAEELLKEHPMK